MKLDQMFPSKYATGADLNGQAHVMTIDSVRGEKIYSGQGGKQEEKFVLYFVGARKGVILSKTLASQIAAILGTDDTDNWKGQKIQLFPEDIWVAGEKKVAIRATKVTIVEPTIKQGF